MAELRPRIPEIRAAGADVVIIGSGAPLFVQGFREDIKLGEDVRVWVDEAVESYRLAGLKRGVGTVLHPLSAVNWVRAVARGHRQRKNMGVPTQQGGLMVVRPDGSIAYHFVSRVTGDRAPLDDVMAVFQKAA